MSNDVKDGYHEDMITLEDIAILVEDRNKIEKDIEKMLKKYYKNIIDLLKRRTFCAENTELCFSWGKIIKIKINNFGGDKKYV